MDSLSADPIDWETAKQFWSFRKPEVRTTPGVRDNAWPLGRLDRFILSELEKAGLAPSPSASRGTFLRRVSYILTGLPPEPEDVARFMADESLQVPEREIDRLLASHAFGERMASPWMNVARYAEDQAHQVGNDVKQFYPNAHLYRHWVMEAFNGDMPYDQFIRLQLAADVLGQDSDLPALGFLGLGPKYYDRQRLSVMADEWEDRVDTVTRGFLGLTVACARCHQHKFDPITAEDYHALAGVFASTEMFNKPLQATDKLKEKIEPIETMHIVRDKEVKDLPVFERGNVDRPGKTEKRHFLTILSEGNPRAFSQGSGRRELADEIASSANPLTSRVMVNRLWAIVFGKPLVATPSNFGSQGAKPTHPELLDDLAACFARDWSTKRLLREMLISQTFRQRSDLTNSDSPNQLLGRMNRRRLPAEMWRDTLLQLSGNLDPAGGASLELSDPKNTRRTVYGRVSRLELNDFLAQFDYPDANVHGDQRMSTTTPTQKLFLLNHPFVLSQAESLAKQCVAWPGEISEKLERLYRAAFARRPSSEETARALAFLGEAKQGTWQGFIQVIFGSNEAWFLD